MIRRVALKSGKAPSEKPLSFEPTSLTIFVGPNNSGKSLVLREIEFFCQKGDNNPNSRIIEDIEFKSFNQSEAKLVIEKLQDNPRPNENIPKENIILEKRDIRFNVNRDDVTDVLTNANQQKSDFAHLYMRLFTTRLDGHGRIKLINQADGGDLHQSPKNNLQFLLQSNEERAKLRDIVYDAFGKYMVIDPTKLGYLRLRLANRPPSDETEERGIDERAVDFHKNAELISNASDGVKAFSGILLELIAGDPSVFLIDEPEAFLHPALSFKLGREVARAASGTDKRIFVSTHSPHFLMGCIQSGVSVNIIRLTYRDGVATSRLLAHSDIVEMLRNPLLRSSGVLSGLFYESVVTTEGDADRAFYQEINERLLSINDTRGIPHCLFINAQNKQTVYQIIEPLRDLGIPAAAIVDIDIIKEGGQVWTNFLKGAFLPDASREALASTRSSLDRKSRGSGQDIKRCGGINIFEKDDREAAESFLKQLQDYGLFIVPSGELESWLSYLEVSGNKSTWLIRIFKKMGDDLNDGSYVSPGKGDVWDFIGRVKKWLFNPERRGVP